MDEIITTISLIDADNIVRMRTIKGSDDWTPPEGYTAIEADGQIGQRWNGTAFEDATPPVVIPDLSPRQLWLGLMTEEIITAAEAEAASLGTIPAFIENVIAALPSEVQRAAARVTIRTGLSVERNNALVIAALATLPVPPTPEAVDAFFIGYSQV